MPTPHELLAKSLEKLTRASIGGIVRHDALPTRDRIRLKANGFITEITKGWYCQSNPGSTPGSTSWYPFYWEFLRQYLEFRFGSEYCLSAEASLLLHAGATTIPQETIILTSAKGVSKLRLPGALSLLMYQDSKNIPADTEAVRGLRVMTMPHALIRVSEAFYRNRPLDAAILLRTVDDPSPLLTLLLNEGKSVVAKRLAGAFRANHQPEIATAIVSTMRRVGYDSGETNPFDRTLPEILVGRNSSPYDVRIRTMWKEMRAEAMRAFPGPPGLPSNVQSYMRRVEGMYVNDAYNSLSIEGYGVTPELIERVRSGNWNPDTDSSDRETRDTLAARGYFEASLEVRKSVEAVVRGESVARVRKDHRDWYQALFAPSVVAGILRPSDLAGYRNHPVFIGGSKHVPPPAEAVIDAMSALFDLIEEEPEASVRAILGHFILVFIHPYGDGNGRVGRFLMNVMLASGGYPWTIVRVENRKLYFEALEAASVDRDIRPFSLFIASELASSSNKI